MKGKTFLLGAFVVLAVLAAWLVYMTRGALERKHEQDRAMPAASATP